MLPLGSPLPSQLSACYSAGKTIMSLREIAASCELGEPWEVLLEILYKGTVYGRVGLRFASHGAAGRRGRGGGLVALILGRMIPGSVEAECGQSCSGKLGEQAKG